MKEYIARLKQKPEHVRKRIVFGTSVGITAFIAIAWIGTTAATGAFALKDPSNAVAESDNSNAVALTPTNVKSNFNQLLGAVSAATNGTSTKPALTIVDGDASSTFDKQAADANNSGSATVIPF